MSITVVTIDFWNTIFDSSGGTHRNATRKLALARAIERAGYRVDPEELNAAYGGIWGYFDDHWLNRQRTPTSGEMVREICRGVRIELPEDVLADVAEVFERGVLDHPPELLPGVRDALEFLARRSRLALISDTAFSPGAVLRRLMEERDVARYFSAWIFSNETGVAKPHPGAFHAALDVLGGSAETALHIGDIERTDIRGAKGAGMRAVLYKGDGNPSKYAETETEADAVLDHWDDIERVLEAIDPG